ncbi:hypothetical protein ACI65C_006586 [Semiaphis heraclei]
MSSSVCLYYKRGSCQFGNRCWNSHDLGSISSDSPYTVQGDSSDGESSFAVTKSRETTSTAASTSSSASRPKQKNQVLPNSANKSSETKAATPKDKWSLTINNTGEARAGTPDSVLLETVKKLNEAENLVVSLRQQLRIKNEGENFSRMEHQMEQCLESDLQCNICYEVFIKPTVLNCSHTFCHACIESWTRRVNHCPTCQVYVKNKSYCLTLDVYLDKISDCLPDETKTRRETLKVERNYVQAIPPVEVNRSRRNNARRRNHRNLTMRQTLGVFWDERDRNGAEWNIALEEPFFDTIRLGDVLGRNRDDRDEWDEMTDWYYNTFDF